jgi:hypothetical protein
LGIRVNALLPGLTKTRFAGALFDDQATYENWISKIPLRRHAEPRENGRSGSLPGVGCRELYQWRVHHRRWWTDDLVKRSKRAVGRCIDDIGFALAQARLGPGRIHHCMRSIGAAELALELMVERSQVRTAFGKRLHEQGTVGEWIAKSRIEIDQARLFVLKAAWMIDNVGAKEARKEISMIKALMPGIHTAVCDRAMQVFGAMGLSPDTPLADSWTWGRALRFADVQCRQTTQRLGQLQKSQIDISGTCHRLRAAERGARVKTHGRVMIRSIITINE